MAALSPHSFLFPLLYLFFNVLFFVAQGGPFANLTIIDSAVEQGAVCLDGSPPGYFLDVGSGCGSDNWVIFLEGGAWCYPAEDCANRAKSGLGSTVGYPFRKYFLGILDHNQLLNPANNS